MASKRGRTAPVWNYMELKRHDLAISMTCKDTFKYSGSTTSNLIKHIRTKHARFGGSVRFGSSNRSRPALPQGSSVRLARSSARDSSVIGSSHCRIPRCQYSSGVPYGSSVRLPSSARVSPIIGSSQSRIPRCLYSSGFLTDLVFVSQVPRSARDSPVIGSSQSRIPCCQ